MGFFLSLEINFLSHVGVKENVLQNVDDAVIDMKNS
jgi:hypothetical protein